ncbi:hypothetical protein PIB30_089289 [Stylosanthes scabra]|uniref:Uncharacterized protein n=1 Tax=Stylosanthes scabra TaxID=79078 RepID=A0ABU6UST4_9FABA|nr:hypothetical protein [Stylosanthes scabra]
MPEPCSSVVRTPQEAHDRAWITPQRESSVGVWESVRISDIRFLAQDSLGSWPGSVERPEIRNGTNPYPGDFSSSVSNRVLFFYKGTILTSNTSVHEPASRFGPALRLPRRSCAESAAFEASRVHPSSTPVHLGDPVQWVSQPMVLLVNRLTGLDQSTPVSHRSTAVKAGQR